MSSLKTDPVVIIFAAPRTIPGIYMCSKNISGREREGGSELVTLKGY